jgi:hypothetical protein
VKPTGQEGLDKLLPIVIPMLAPSLAQDGWKVGVEDLRGLLESGGMELWICQDTETLEVIAALATEIHDYPRARVFSLAFCGGKDMERWAPWIDALEGIAAARGCTHVRIPGRKGWGRVFEGYREVHRIYEKALSWGEAGG